MTWSAWCCAAFVGCAAMFSLVHLRSDRGHWPIAVLLTAWAFDPLRLEGGALACAWVLSLPALSAAVATLVLARSPPTAPFASALVLGIGAAKFWQAGDTTTAMLAASLAALAVQIRAATTVAGRPLTLADRCALVLLAGDVAALAGPLGDAASLALQRERWGIAQWQGALVAIVLCALHIAAAPPARHA